jgi:hypothetical protein
MLHRKLQRMKWPVLSSGIDGEDCVKWWAIFAKGCIDHEKD